MHHTKINLILPNYFEFMVFPQIVRVLGETNLFDFRGGGINLGCFELLCTTDY